MAADAGVFKKIGVEKQARARTVSDGRGDAVMHTSTLIGRCQKSVKLLYDSNVRENT